MFENYVSKCSIKNNNIHMKHCLSKSITVSYIVCVLLSHKIQSGPKKCIHSLLINIFGISYDSVSMPMVATSNTFIESKIQGHRSYQFCFCINTVVTIIE
jgi:hypothetical protein